MDVVDKSAPTDAWRKTKEAAANFRRLLLCSKCSNLMKDPVCLGMCEHMLCRSCAGHRAGDGCVVCHSPAWVKDIQINRQLSSIIELFCGLDSLLDPTEQPENRTQPASPIFQHKKNFKIWFSPRSRKVRCTVEKPAEVSAVDSRSSEEASAAQSDTITALRQDLSVFNFTSSSQDSGSPSQRGDDENRKRKKRSTKKNAAGKKAPAQGATALKQTKQVMKQKRLEAINKQWGITEEEDPSNEEQQPRADETMRRSSKRVSFHSPDQLQADVPQESSTDFSPDESTTRESLAEGGSTGMNHEATADKGMSEDVGRQNSPLANDLGPSDNPEKEDNVSPPKSSSKRSRVAEKGCAVETTPKRPRVSPARRGKYQISPVVLNPSGPVTSPKERRRSPFVLAAVGRRSPGNHGSPLGKLSPGSPAIMKRNHKGETPLHLASIKGDVEAVKELLDQGADPNLKDNAGWTPLHEACNLGHMAVVEVLISKGALLNTPGYENYSPLHDAVRNGHPAIARLLLQHGASQNVLNLYGKRPADYAVTVEMLEIFQEASEGTQYANPPLSPSASLTAVSDCVRRDQLVVFLPSKLPQPALLQLAKLGELLGGRSADAFSGSVSHVVVPEGHMPTTYSTLLGLLAGCWVVRYSWVEACLQAGEWMPETEHEAGEGPQRSRLNRLSLLPPLFDGCFFFLLGSFKDPAKDELTRLLREGGGQFLNRQPKPESDVTQTLSAAAYHALPGSDQALCTQYIIYDPQGPHKPPMVRRGKVWSAPTSWIIDCIAAFRLLPVPDPQSSV